MYVPRLCSWYYLVASDTGWYTTGRYSTAPVAYWYYGARIILFVFFHQEDVYCDLCSDHGLELRKTS